MTTMEGLRAEIGLREHKIQCHHYKCLLKCAFSSSCCNRKAMMEPNYRQQDGQIPFGFTYISL